MLWVFRVQPFVLFCAIDAKQFYFFFFFNFSFAETIPATVAAPVDPQLLRSWAFLAPWSNFHARRVVVELDWRFLMDAITNFFHPVRF